MNLSDVKIDYSQYEGQDIFSVIFQKQKMLIQLYEVPNVDLDVPKDQQILRVLAWCVIEEAAEALDVIWTTNDPEHLKDEVADMMHFYVELLILSGIDSVDFRSQLLSEIEPIKMTLADVFTVFSVHLALAINCLKNRFWRKTNLKTDQVFFLDSIKKTIPDFMSLVHQLGLTPDDLIDSYLRKNEINLFRIRSKY
jgi:NTP pyrophosphatase (non-canonical NTP hydrolase)